MAYIRLGDAATSSKNIVGYKVTWIERGQQRMRVFKIERRATTFKANRPFGSNAVTVPIVKASK